MARSAAQPARAAKPAGASAASRRTTDAVASASASVSADRYRRTRAQHRDESAEDYVEAIAQLEARVGSARVVALAQEMGVSHVTVMRTLARLSARGLVITQRHKPVRLTPKGQRLAQMSSQRHEVVLAFLLWLGVSKRQAITDAEGIEHHVSKQTIAAMQRRLNNRA